MCECIEKLFSTAQNYAYYKSILVSEISAAVFDDSVSAENCGYLANI